MISKWEKEKKALEYKIFTEKLSYEEIGRQYGCSGSNIKKVAKKLGIQLKPRRKISKQEIKKIQLRATSSHIEHIKYSNCLNCGKKFEVKHSCRGKFCCNKCAQEYKYKHSILLWKQGKKSGTNGFNCATYVRRYLFEKYHNKCQICGWGKINKYTGKIPLQVHHIDGNCLNNKENNLILLCSNCHSLTENFGSRNKNGLHLRSIYYGRAKVKQ